jgi:hypothetical protein
LFERFKKRLGLISSKEMWPIISFYCLTRHTKSRSGQPQNCFSKFWDKILSARESSNISHLKSQRRISERPNLFKFSIRLQILILRRVLTRSNITNPKTEYYLHYRGSVYCTEQDFGTFYMRSF